MTPTRLLLASAALTAATVLTGCGLAGSPDAPTPAPSASPDPGTSVAPEPNPVHDEKTEATAFGDLVLPGGLFALADPHREAGAHARVRAGAWRTDATPADTLAGLVAANPQYAWVDVPVAAGSRVRAQVRVGGQVRRIVADALSSRPAGETLVRIIDTSYDITDPTASE